LRDQLQNVAGAVQEQEMLDATTAALESEAESLRDQLNNYVELAQVGMALASCSTNLAPPYEEFGLRSAS
jgi:hypothetical protein